MVNLDFIQLSKQHSNPIYLQLVEEIVKGIQQGFLKNGQKLPGTRKLTEVLRLNRNTIVKSFEELEAQGWIQIIPNKGTYIINLNENNISIKALTVYKFPAKAAFTFEKSILLDVTQNEHKNEYQLSDGAPDPRIIELKIPGKAYASILKRKNLLKKSFDHQFFFKQFTNYLNISRNLKIDSSNILITRNREMALQISAKVILQKNDYVAISDLSYYKSNMIFQSNQAKIIQINTDKDGLNPEHLEEICRQKSIRALYISPNQHYPTAVSLSNQRKLELKRLAKKYQFIIIEDDFEFDYYYTNRPNFPMISTNYDGNSIYLGNFGSELAPGYRLSFVIGPTDFINEAKKQMHVYDSLIDPLVTQTLGELIYEGEISRILKKHRKIYREKRDYFCNLLLQFFGNEIQFKFPKSGLAIWIQFKNPLNLMQLKKDAETLNLYIPQNILYQTNTVTGIRIGFSDLSEDEMYRILKIIEECIYKQIKNP